MLAYTPMEFNFLETLAKTIIIFSEKTSSFKKTFSALLQFVRLLLQRPQTLHPLDHTLKILSVIKNFYLRQIRIHRRGQPIQTVMLLIFFACTLRQ